MTQKKSFCILEVPIDSIGISGGTEKAPNALREAGIARAINALGSTTLPVEIRDETRDPETGIKGFGDVCKTTSVIGKHVKEVLQKGQNPFLVGGCCTELLGAMAGACDYLGKTETEIGLAYLDGHMDLYDGNTSPTGESADMPIATLLGYGPEQFKPFLGNSALLKAENLVLIGYRDSEEASALEAMMPEDVGVKLYFDADTVRKNGAALVGKKTYDHLSKRPGKYWVHLDFDVLDQDEFPATDYLMPNGLTWKEVVSILKPLVSNEGMIGMSIACYNPEKDLDGKCAEELVNNLGLLFS